MNKGFSLIEIIIVVAIAASIVIVVGNLGTNVAGLNNLINQELQSKSGVNQALNIMTSEIRSAGPSQNGAFPIDAVSTSSFSFYSDINKDGTIEHVRYFLATSSIEKGVIQPTGSPATYPTSSEILTDVIDNVIIQPSSSLFSYYGATYTGSQSPLAAPIDISTIRLIGIFFYADIQPKQAPSAQYFSTFVDIRNLRSN